MENLVRQKLFAYLKMQQLNCESTDMIVCKGKTDFIIMYAINNGEEIELYYSKN